MSDPRTVKTPSRIRVRSDARSISASMTAATKSDTPYRHPHPVWIRTAGDHPQLIGINSNSRQTSTVVHDLDVERSFVGQRKQTRN
jgi:hypothetical protein